MVHFVFHLDGVTDLAVSVGADGIRIFLVLHRLDVVLLLPIWITGRIYGVCVPVAGLAHNARFIRSPAVKIFHSIGPMVKAGGIIFRRSEIHVAIETVGFIQPGGSRFDLSYCLYGTGRQMAYEPCGARLPIFLFFQQEAEGMVLKGAVA